MNIDVIGVMYDRVSGGIDEDGIETFVLVEKQGYHVNTDERIQNIETLSVNTPFRKFAGSNVVYCYRFNSKYWYYNKVRCC